MKESEKRAVASAIVIAFCGGFILGEKATRKYIESRFERRKTLVTNALVSAVNKARNENLTEDEFAAELEREAEFINIIEG